MYHALILNVHNMGSKRPPGAHRIASFLREHDWDVEVIDYAIEFKKDELEEVIRSRINSKTIFIGYSCFFGYWDERFESITEWIRKKYPNIKQIIGGQSKPRTNSKNIDYFIHGFGEYAMLELVKSFIGNSGNVILDPLYFGDKKVISANKFYPAFPMRSLKIKYEDRDYLQPWEWLTIEFGRGCKFKCSYCNFPNLGVKGDQTRDASDFEEEMKENYERWGITQYYCADETFNDRVEKIEKFAAVTDRLNFKPFFSGFIRADLMISRKEREFEALKRLGFLGQFYGIETMNHASGKAIGKGMDPEKLKEGLIEARNYFSKYGTYRGAVSLIIGLPHETIETQLATLKWAEDYWQGEALHVWPLEIPLNPKTDVLSVLSGDYKKFGYRESNKILPGSLDDNELKDFNGNLTRVKSGISNLNWENDHMSLTDAYEISNQFWTRVYNDELFFGVTTFNFGDHMIYGNITRSEFLKIKMFKLPPSTWNHDRFYIEKKLK